MLYLVYHCYVFFVILLLAIVHVLSDIRFTASDYPHGVFKLFMWYSLPTNGDQ